jgi:hypothetical protein
MKPALKKIAPKISVFQLILLEYFTISAPVTRRAVKQIYSKKMCGFLFQNGIIGGGA